MNVYKFVILWLVTIPIIFSATFLNVPEINTIETQLIEPYDIFGQEAFFKIKFSNNAVSGYTINVKSANGSQFNLNGSNACVNANIDACILDYKFHCSSFTLTQNGPDTIMSEGEKTLLSSGSGTAMINVSNPNTATEDAETRCSFKLDNESKSELFKGTYSDTITVEISSL